ncbi:hypothetical protein SAY87_017308 [Trapa incisa]|uniref:Uncharacterized protein n=1 Tax=Trapa incisa TaxID=236973 RepID=A0AAN7QW23_9MYRT|nr:hypothetical protein SAY87_017308 [Trapa incisa]
MKRRTQLKYRLEPLRRQARKSLQQGDLAKFVAVMAWLVVIQVPLDDIVPSQEEPSSVDDD